ncbi:uncharacterized protein LOC115267412 [Aedes albopictus]|uniref:NACHT domain-containing protein n=1 Tax=Aedes albopictus TaxID=7160 RepID=A0ABM1YRC2_AEDAL
MVYSKQDDIHPEASETYESSTKSGSHGELYQKQLAQILLLRLTREGKKFRLAYELTIADKFDDVALHDKSVKQWTLIQSKHADAKDSKVDINGLLPKTNREKGDFSLYKYFHSYLKVRSKFRARTNFVLFTNKKLDEKLETAENCLAIEDRDVDEYLRFTSEGATHKVLTPTDATIQSIVEYANEGLYSLKDAIKQLFTDGIITNELQKYNAYLKDILWQSENHQIRFKETFNDSLIFIAKVYKVLQPELRNLDPINKPLKFNIEVEKCESPTCLIVEGQYFDNLITAIKELFHKGVASDDLKKYKDILDLIFTTTANGQLTIKETFNDDVVCKAELYKMLKAELCDLNKEVTTKQKLFDIKASRTKHRSVLFYAEASDVEQFFSLLTLSVQQPDRLEPFIVEELYSWMRMWLRPDVLGKLTEDDYKDAAKDLDDFFDATQKCEQGNSKYYLTQRDVSRYCNKLRSKIVKLHPELNDMDQLYINRILSFERENIDAPEHVKDAKFDGNKKSEPDPSCKRVDSTACDTSNNDREMDNKISLPDRTYEEVTDTQLARSLKLRFARYQCLVLTADPGIGKTKLLQYVALEHEKCKSGAAFLIYLNRLQDVVNVSGNKSSLDVLKSVLSQKNVELIQNVLEKKSNDYITILFDGYDEIHEKNRSRINHLFESLLESEHIQLIVSVRNHEKKTLQSFFKKRKIHALYFSLEPFNSKNIIEYLAKSWNENAECNIDSKFDSYSQFLVKKFDSLCRVPLMAKMVSKIYKEGFEKFKETKFIDHEDERSYLEEKFLEVEHIYEYFIEKCLLIKINDECGGIGKVNANKQIVEGFYLDHQLLAIEYLDVGDLKPILKNPKYMTKLNDIRERHRKQNEKSILLKFEDGKLLFSHHSYAEFFVAVFLWDDFVYLKSIIENVLSAFAGIRRFLIKIIEKNIKCFIPAITRKNFFASKKVAFWACESNAVELLKYVRSKKALSKNNKAEMLHIAIKNGSDKICSYLIDNCKLHPDVKYNGGLLPLYSAITYGHRNLVQLLIDKGANLHIRNTEGWSVLHYAVQHNQIAISSFLIDKDIDVNSISNNKWNALHISCNNGDADMTQMLIRKGAQLDKQTNEDKTALDLAAAGGHTAVVNILTDNLIKEEHLNGMICKTFQTAVHYGHNSVKEMLIKKYPELADPKYTNDPLIHLAAQKGMVKDVKQYIDHGANVNALDRTDKTALHLSASAGHSLVVELLLNRGARLNAIERHKCTPLHLACQNGHKEVVQILIKSGANIASLNNDKWTALHLSAFHGYCGVVNLLLKKGANVNAIGKHGMTPLFSACQNDHKDVVQILLQKGANINALSSNKWTALHRSASEGRYDIVKLLLKKGANINAVDIDEWTPLHWACQNGHKKVVETLIKRKANIDALTDKKSTALHKSASGGYSDIVDLLLKKHVNVNDADKEKLTALHWACQNGHKGVVETLIKRGAHIHAVTRNRRTALHESATKGYCDIVVLLLDEGANVNAVDIDEWTPLHWACQNGHKEVVQTLLSRGAKIDALTHNRSTALHKSAFKGYCDIVVLLLDKGANVNAVDIDKWTSLLWACRNGHEEVVKALLSRNVNMGALILNNWTALHVSASEGYCVIVDLLLAKDANINAVDIGKWTPLHWACQNGHKEVVQTLLSRGANIEVLTHNNLTALHVGASKGHCIIVDLLLAKGANINAVDIDKWTPLHWASQNGHKEVVQTLLSRGANIEVLTHNNSTALHVGASKGHCIIVDLLLAKGANINAVDIGKLTPLHWAC